MADMLQTGVSGLRTSQRGLATTSHNISNVNTDGFSRQRVEQDTSVPMYTGRGAIGTGSRVQTIQRLTEDTAVENLRRSHAEFERLDTLERLTSRIDNLVADKDAGVSPALREFFDAVEELATDPSNTVAAQQVLTKGEALSDRFQTVDDRLLDLMNDVNRRIEAETSQVNALAESIADLNQEIRRRWTQPNRPPNDLLDQRDEKIRELSELVEVRVTEQDDRTLNVAIGTGQPLVTGARTNDLQMRPNPFDPERPELFVEQGERLLQVTESVRGGSLGGLIEFREGVLDETRDEIGRVATAISAAFNEQHRRGVHFDEGEPRHGDDFFTVPEVGVAAHPDNATRAEPQVAVDGARVGQLTGDNYQLFHDGDDWVLRSEGDGRDRVLGVDVEADDDGLFRVDGLVIAPPEEGVEGDVHRITPTREGAQNIEGRLSRPTQVAAASPTVSGQTVDASGQSSNTGRGHIGTPEVGDPDGVMEALEAGGALHQGIVLEYVEEPDGTSYFQVYVGGEPLPDARLRYEPDDREVGEEFNLSQVEGLEELDIAVNLSGSPDPGDRFSVQGNFEGIGDNTNALRLAELAESAVMDDGNSTFQEAYSAMVGEVGSFSQRVQTNRDAQDALLNQAKERWEEISGVNLDEEAANMVQLQQHYQAAAQVITAADEVFQELLMAVRR